ncbi:hypothetical protein QWY31_07665 [Cytophagales bacterium LB-30]|uniref:Uncharacterized protein n=1 Tax=Shiella aurantiaca TaxID=3058365 RepID=A0ABT8F528_9BACT|nr:hypothetical protein [Shiella aurantiaca]MDN4165374.1 hypothetical protein [Shiella aurantiaca]
MKTKHLNVDSIGSQEPLTKEEETLLKEFFSRKKEDPNKLSKVKTLSSPLKKRSTIKK